MEVALVLRHHGLGDLITAQPALKAIKKRFPGLKVVTTCPSWLVDLATHFGSVDAVVTERDHPNVQVRGDPSRHLDIDLAMLSAVSHNFARPKYIISLRTPDERLSELVETLRPQSLLSYYFEGIHQTAGIPTIDFSDHILTRWKKLLAFGGIFPNESDLYTSIECCDDDRGYTIVHPGAGSDARLWPIERWGEVARKAAQNGHRILISGSAGEAERCLGTARLAGLPKASVLAGTTGIMKLAQYVAGARVVLSVDTGIAHLATAFRTPAITIFGPVSPECWGPPPDNPQHTAIWKGYNGDPYGKQLDPGLDNVSAAEVSNVLLSY